MGRNPIGPALALGRRVRRPAALRAVGPVLPEPPACRLAASAADRSHTTRSPGEEDVPTQQSQTLEEARVPASLQHACRQGRAAQSPKQGTSTAERVILRLTHREDFVMIRRSGVQRRSGPLAARVVCSAHPVVDVRVGYAIGRRFGTAVKRNRMRRRLRHCVAQLTSEGPMWISHALVSAAPSALTLGHADLIEHCRSVMRPCEQMRGPLPIGTEAS